MLKFSHISRPCIFQQFVFGFPCQSVHFFFFFFFIMVQKVFGKQDDVIAAFMELRYMYFNRVDTI